MRKIYLLFALLFSALIATTQPFEISIIETGSVINQDDTLHVVGSPDENVIIEHLLIENTSTSTITVQLRRQDYDVPAGMSPYFCIGDQCYPPQTVISGEFSLEPDETITFDAEIEPAGNTGDALIKYSLQTISENREMLSFYVHYSIAPTGVNESLLTQFMLYPNPVKNVLNVRFNGEADLNSRIEVYNTVGKLMKAQKIAVKNDYQVDMSNLTNGIYMVKLMNSEGVIQTRKVLKK